ncbi:MAG: hypothetical protein HRU06_14375 [Oceanospirillaceae bacterium]|nr:hypothetical protein [Oceanospirillaceae bacterium]
MKNLVLLCWSVTLLSWPIITQANLPGIVVWLYPFIIWLLMMALCIKAKGPDQQHNNQSDR